MYTITRADSLVELASIADSWNLLVERSPHLLPTSSYAWISSYLEHRLKEGETWTCYLAHRGQELAGVLPLVITRTGPRMWREYVLRLPHDLHTISADVVCGSDDSTKIAEALVAKAFQDFPKATVLAFSRIPDGSSALQWLKCGTRTPRHTIEWDGNGAYFDTRVAYEIYRAELSSKFRRNQNYYSNKIATLPGYAQQTWVGSEARPEHLERFIGVEAANWKGQAGSAILNSEPLRQFYATLVERLYECGWLRWSFIEVDRNPIAGLFAVQVGSRQIAWKYAYDAAYEQLSAGTILLDTLIRKAFEDPKIDELDLLSDYPFLSKWRVALRPYYNLRVYRRGPITTLIHYVPVRVTIELRRIPFLHRVWTQLKNRFKRVRA